jgi:hypothetical protein
MDQRVDEGLSDGIMHRCLVNSELPLLQGLEGGLEAFVEFHDNAQVKLKHVGVPDAVGVNAINSSSRVVGVVGQLLVAQMPMGQELTNGRLLAKHPQPGPGGPKLARVSALSTGSSDGDQEILAASLKKGVR